LIAEIAAISSVQWRQPLCLHAVFVHEAGVKIAHLLCNASFCGSRRRLLNEFEHALTCFLVEDCACIATRLTGRYRYRFQPAPVGIAIKIVTRLDGTVDIVRAKFCAVVGGPAAIKAAEVKRAINNAVRRAANQVPAGRGEKQRFANEDTCLVASDSMLSSPPSSSVIDFRPSNRIGMAVACCLNSAT
jgi:hypothetical protein